MEPGGRSLGWQIHTLSSMVRGSLKMFKLTFAAKMCDLQSSGQLGSLPLQRVVNLVAGYIYLIFSISLNV